MMMMGGLASTTGFSAREIEEMSSKDLYFWTNALNLYSEEVKRQNEE